MAKNLCNQLFFYRLKHLIQTQIDYIDLELAPLDEIYLNRIPWEGQRSILDCIEYTFSLSQSYLSEIDCLQWEGELNKSSFYKPSLAYRIRLINRKVHQWFCKKMGIKPKRSASYCFFLEKEKLFIHRAQQQRLLQICARLERLDLNANKVERWRFRAINPTLGDALHYYSINMQAHYAYILTIKKALDKEDYKHIKALKQA